MYEKLKTQREGKGKSLIDFPEKYTVIDIETTGLSAEFDEIIEIAAVKYSDGKEVDSFETLVKPSRPLDEYITQLTGITDEMLEDAPDISESILKFQEFIKDDILVGYNINFDINFLYDNLKAIHDKTISNDFIDVLRIARKALPDLLQHRQKDIAAFFNIPVDTDHRAKADCDTCKKVFEKLKEKIITESSIEDFKNSFKKTRAAASAKDVTTDKTEFDETHPLYKKICVFTGKLDKMERAEAWQIVADFGGIPEERTTKKTNYLILGNNDYCKTIKDGKSQKQKKAEGYILKGQDLEIIPENVFYDMIFED